MVLLQNVIRTGEDGDIGLTVIMHGAVLMDEGDEVLIPAIIWCDQHTDAQCRMIT